jgi:putative acetyltransferase
VLPDHQGSGVGAALMHAVLGAADACDEPLVGLVGEPAYYRRFGFAPGADRGIDAPDPDWGDYFQVRALSAYTPDLRGRFRYAPPFDAL